MKHFLSRVLSLVLVLGLILSCVDLTAYAADTGTINVIVNGTYKQTDARSMLTMVNELRTGSNAWYLNSDNSTKTYCTNLSPLVYDYSLEEIAMQRAMEIAVYYSHTRPNGQDCFSAYDDFNYRWYAVGENIAVGYTSVSAMFTGWAEENEPYAKQGHRRNMLSSNFTRIGIACVSVGGYLYWVQEFANGNGSTTKTAANDSATDKQVSILASNATITMTASPASVTIEPGKSAALPQITAGLTTPSAFPSGRKTTIRPVSDYSYTSSDTSILTVNTSTKNLTGIKDGTCKLTVSAFNKSLEIPVTVKGHSHTYTSKVTTSATCSKEGVKTYTCSECGNTYTESIPKTAHTRANAVRENEKASTCTRTGSYDSVIYCTVCKTELERTSINLPLASHTEAKAVKENEKSATCTRDGSYDSVVYCSVCRAELKRITNTVKASGHTYESKTIDSTCTTAGRTTYTCKVCGDSYTENIPAKGHTVGTAVKENEKAASCTAPGSYDSVVYCQVCHEKLSVKKVTFAATGHDYAETVTPPTTESVGFTTYTCKNCGDSYIGNYTDPLTIDLSSLSVKLSYTLTTYNGQYKKPSVSIQDGDKELLKDVDFTVSYKDYKNPGIATVTINGIGSYSGRITKNFTIRPKEAEITSVTNLSTGSKVSWDKVYGVSGYYVYRKTGSEDFKKIKTLTDGSLSYTDTSAKTNGKKYSYKVIAYKTTSSTTIKAKDSNIFASYYISRLSFTSLKAGIGRFTVSWEKNSKASGYQLQYSRSSSFSTKTTKAISGSATLKKSVSSLKKGSTYYVKLRAYKTVSGKKYYSAWTAKKSVVIK